MTRNGVHITTWVLGILATLAGAFGGALFNHFFGRQAVIEAERRNEVRKASDDYFSKRATDAQGALAASYRLLIYANSDVLRKYAEANRVMAKASVSENTTVVEMLRLCTETPGAHRVVSAQVSFIASVRAQTLQGDPLADRDIVAIVCPVLTAPCFGQKYATHLLDCGEAGAK